MIREVLRLAGLLACIALATSRIGLVAHELVGHGGVALLAGARNLDVQLFYFGGGWIRYLLTSSSLAWALAIAMAGITLELVIGTTLWWAVRGPSLGRILVRGVGAALVLHATWYLALGTFNGFGDGLLLYHVLGEARVAVAIAAGLGTCAAGFLGARLVFAPLAHTLSGTAGRRVAGLLVAIVLGAGLHAGLTIGEIVLRRDRTYTQVMQPERERRIAIDFERWQRDQAARGTAPSPTETQEARTRIERAHARFPFVIVLALATLLAIIAGAWGSRSSLAAGQGSVTARLVARAAIVAGTSLALVIVIDALLG